VGNDAALDFSAQTLPPGSAPSDRTFQPSPISGQNQNPEITDEVRTSAKESIHGATSADLNKGIGQPMIGETSRELRHNAEIDAGLVDYNTEGLVRYNTNKMAQALQDLRYGCEKVVHNNKSGTATISFGCFIFRI
jgi:hypothetical protein